MKKIPKIFVVADIFRLIKYINYESVFINYTIYNILKTAKFTQ